MNFIIQDKKKSVSPPLKNKRVQKGGLHSDVSGRRSNTVPGTTEGLQGSTETLLTQLLLHLKCSSGSSSSFQPGAAPASQESTAAGRAGPGQGQGQGRVRARARAGSGPLRVVLLVAVQLVRIVGGHVGEVLEDVLVGFISCRREEKENAAGQNQFTVQPRTGNTGS